MPLIKAYTMPHPPLAVPGVGRGQENEISKTLAAADEVAREIASIAPETIIYITPHSVLYSDYFHISPGAGAHGDFGRFAAPGIKLETKYDQQLAQEISRIAELSDVSAGFQGERDPKLDHGVMVPMWFINQRYSGYSSIRISQSGMAPAEHYLLGQVIAKAIETTGRKTVLIASSDLSHKLEDDGPYGYAPEGPKFDALFIEALANADFLTLMQIPESLRERAAECGYNSLTILAGCFDKQNVEAKLMSYEGPFGVGYAVATFIPTGYDDSRNILERFIDHAIEKSNERKNAEDEHQKLARQSLEHVITTGEILSVPKGLPQELEKTKAGVFVSLHKNGRLRGCIGTIAPTTQSIAEEIIQNAVSAGLSDNRFAPVNESELPYLTYKVDVLSAPEPISGPGELDVKRYGVIVSTRSKRGLLLPNLDGIDSIEDQIDIARNKAGISENEPITLERFEVIRHE